MKTQPKLIPPQIEIQSLSDFIKLLDKITLANKFEILLRYDNLMSQFKISDIWQVDSENNILYNESGLIGFY